jgi:hypothetical protein
LHGFLLAHPSLKCKEDLTMVALLHYGLYMVTNRSRGQGPLSPIEAFDAVNQAAMEGAKGHKNSTKTWDSRWQRAAPKHDLPTMPLSQLDSKIRRLQGLGNAR